MKRHQAAEVLDRILAAQPGRRFAVLQRIVARERKAERSAWRQAMARVAYCLDEGAPELSVRRARRVITRELKRSRSA